MESAESGRIAAISDCLANCAQKLSEQSNNKDSTETSSSTQLGKPTIASPSELAYLVTTQEDTIFQVDTLDPAVHTYSPVFVFHHTFAYRID